MAMRISRRKLALRVADRLLAGVSTKETLNELAAFLVDTRRTREQELVVRDIEAALAEKGMVVADITSAFPLDQTLRQAIGQLVGGDTLAVREAIDPSVLGGVRVDIPGKRFDGTIRRKLTALKAQQV